MQLGFEQLSADGPWTAGLVIQPFQTFAGHVFIWAVGPKRSVNLFNCALKTLFLTYSFFHFYAPPCRSCAFRTAGVQRWSAERRNGDDIALEYNARVQHIGVSSPDDDPVYFVAPGSLSAVAD